MITTYDALQGFPADFTAPDRTIRPVYSRHARDEARFDKYGMIDLPSVIDLSEFYIFEIAMEGKSLKKIGIRKTYRAGLDICLVIAVEPGRWFVKTVWTNVASDRPLVK